MSTSALTGNFGMGKSTVLELFSELGAITFSADTFVHTILNNRKIIGEVSSILGKDVLLNKSGLLSINKKKVADIIFHDPRKRTAVEKIIHPEVLKAILTKVSEINKEKKSPTIVIEVPLLFESGYEHYFDNTIVVFCSEEQALQRLSQKGFTRNEAILRMQAQMDIAKKIELADYAINNNRTIENTMADVKVVYSNLIKN